MSANPLRFLRDYRDLPGAFGPGKMVAAAFARAPYAMLPLGIMTAFTASTGDIAVGGLVTAVFSISVAFCAPLIGRAADMFGQRRVLLVTVPANALALLSLFWAATTSLQQALVYPLGLLAGMTSAPIGSFTRARWVGMNPTPHTLTAAFSYESMADELVFVLGPALVGIAATAAAPSAPLLLAFAITVLAGLPFALTAPPKAAFETESAGEPLPTHPPIRRVILAVFPAIAALIAVGAFFGSTQVAVTARAEELAHPSAAGLVYATMGISSALTSLLVVALPRSFSLPARFILFSVAVSALTVATAFSDSLAGTAFWFLLTGAFIGPTLVTAFTLAERLAPTGGIAVAMTLMTSSVTIGVSSGAAFGGRIAEAAGSATTLFFSATVVLVVALVAIILSVRGRKKDLPLKVT